LVSFVGLGKAVYLRREEQRSNSQRGRNQRKATDKTVRMHMGNAWPQKGDHEG